MPNLIKNFVLAVTILFAGASGCETPAGLDDTSVAPQGEHPSDHDGDSTGDALCGPGSGSQRDLDRAIEIMDPHVDVDDAGAYVDHEGLRLSLLDIGEEQTAGALYDGAEMTPLAEEILGLESALSLADSARVEMSGLRGIQVNWKWYGVDIWWTGSSARTYAALFKAGTTAAIAGIVGYVSTISASAATIAAAALGGLLNSLADSYIDHCASDEWIGLRVYWIGRVGFLC